jgi:hypothetical protein
VESVNDKLNSLHKGYFSIDAASLRSLGFNRSGPIALVMERLVYKHIYNYLIDNNLITSHQSGFTPGDSAVNQLLYITR